MTTNETTLNRLFHEIKGAMIAEKKYYDFLKSMIEFVQHATPYRFTWIGMDANSKRVLNVWGIQPSGKEGVIWRRNFGTTEEAILWALRHPNGYKKEITNDDE